MSDWELGVLIPNRDLKERLMIIEPSLGIQRG